MMEKEQSQGGALPRRVDCDPPTIVEHLELTEQAELHERVLTGAWPADQRLRGSALPILSRR